MYVETRDFRPEDFDTLWRIDQECFPAGIAYSRPELLHYMNRRGAFTLVAERQGSIAGFIVLEVSRVRRTAHVITIDVVAAARRTGAGSLLLRVAEARARAAGCTAIYLETAVDNAGAIAFYKQHGYFVLRTLPRYYLGELDALMLGKKLSAQERFAGGVKPETAG